MSSIWRWVLCRKTELIIVIRKGEGKSMLKEVCAGRVAKLPRLLVPFFPSQPAKTKKSDDWRQWITDDEDPCIKRSYSRQRWSTVKSILSDARLEGIWKQKIRTANLLQIANKNQMHLRVLNKACTRKNAIIFFIKKKKNIKRERETYESQHLLKVATEWSLHGLYIELTILKLLLSSLSLTLHNRIQASIYYG